MDRGAAAAAEGGVSDECRKLKGNIVEHESWNAGIQELDESSN
jgi:hypothetical protein